MWASELGTVVTSHGRWRCHCQLQWSQLMPSPIVLNVINAIIVRHQSSHKTNPSNTTRKAVAISLKAIRRPCQQMQQGCFKGVLSNTTKLPQRKQDKCNHEPGGPLSRNLRQIGQFHAPDLPRQTWDQQQNMQKRTCKQQQKNTAIVLLCLPDKHQSQAKWQHQWHCS